MRVISAVVFVLTLCVAEAAAQAPSELRDPMTRDEDISGSQVQVDVVETEFGYYEYTYSIINTAANKGIIRDFVLDVSCDLEFEPVTFQEPPSPNERASSSRDGKHVPLQLYGVANHDWRLVVSTRNTAVWLVYAKPGQDVIGFRVLSPAPPGPREFTLIPDMDTEGWDYGRYEPDVDVPATLDFTVSGIVVGPSCSKDVAPEPQRFAGTSHGAPPLPRMVDPNWLISYSDPLVDQLHLPEDAVYLDMTIHYAENLNPQTFRVTQERGLSRLFNPVPGTSETVQFPLSRGINRVEIQGQSRFEGPTRAEKGNRIGRGGPSVDRDVFVIRVGTSPDHGHGKGRSEGRSDGR